jgi:hypothetical protein
VTLGLRFIPARGIDVILITFPSVHLRHVAQVFQSLFELIDAVLHLAHGEVTVFAEFHL